MPTRVCDICNNEQILKSKIRSTTCRPCIMKYKPLRLGTGKGWHVHKQTGYIIGRENGKQYYQHRWIMEQHLGRPLTTQEHVHHINGNRADNRIENLEVISASDHAREHTIEKNRKTNQHIRAANIRWGNI